MVVSAWIRLWFEIYSMGIKKNKIKVKSLATEARRGGGKKEEKQKVKKTNKITNKGPLEIYVFSHFMFFFLFLSSVTPCLRGKAFDLHGSMTTMVV